MLRIATCIICQKMHNKNIKLSALLCIFTEHDLNWWKSNLTQNINVTNDQITYWTAPEKQEYFQSSLPLEPTEQERHDLLTCTTGNSLQYEACGGSLIWRFNDLLRPWPTQYIHTHSFFVKYKKHGTRSNVVLRLNVVSAMH